MGVLMDYQQPPQAYPTPAPVPEKKGPPKWLFIVGGIFACICIGCSAFAAFGYFIGEQEKTAYADGHAAYLAGDCATAVTKLDSLTGEALSTQAAPELDQCRVFQSAKEQHDAGNRSAALSGYLSAASLGGGLDATISPALERLFSEATPDQLVSDALCSDSTLFSNNLRLAPLNANAPKLLTGCGSLLVASDKYSEATDIYAVLSQSFPDYEMTADEEAMMANALLLAAKAAGAGEIGAPQVSGETGTGNTVVIIQNDSPESMRIIFTGPETRIEELAACTDCETHLIAPTFCPEQGPVGSYELPPGTYEVLVESTSDSGTTPFTGTWELAAGDEYYSCFFVTEGP